MIQKPRPVTSASNLFRRALCPGSARMEAACPPEPENEDARAGTKLHQIMAGDLAPCNLTDDEKWCLDFCRSTAADICEKYLGPSVWKETHEVALFLEGEEFGHADCICRNSELSIIFDWKFGRVPVEPAEANLQGRTYALLHYKAGGTKRVLVVIVQPRVEADKKITVCEYNAQSLAAAELEIKQVLEAAAKPDAPLKPGMAQCRYCRARAVCPAATKFVDSLANELVPMSGQLTDSKRVAELLNACELAEKVIDAVRGKAKELLRAGVPLDGWTLRAGARRRVISDPQKAFETMQSVVSQQDFVKSCSVKIAELETFFRKGSGLKGREARDAFKNALSLAGCLEIKEGDQQLIRAEKQSTDQINT